MDLTVSKPVARRYLLKKLLLWPPYSLSGLSGVDGVFQSLRCIQFDPLSPAGNNVDLVLQSRLSDYRISDYHYWLYHQDKGIETYDKVLSIIPKQDMSLVSANLSHYHLQRINDFISAHRPDLEKLIKYIGRFGPVSSLDIKDPRRLASWWGTNSSWAQTALTVLWELGIIKITSRRHTRKYYSLVTPETDLNHLVVSLKPQSQPSRARVLRRLEGAPILPLAGSGTGWLGLGSATLVSPVIRQLVQDGQLIVLQIEGSSKKYVIKTEDHNLLTGSGLSQGSFKPQVSFIAPLDNLIWDRNLISDLFGFDYRWEVYTPEIKRRYGYYVLPILYGDQFIGRLEPHFDKKTGHLHIKGLWKEFSWTPEMENSYQLALAHFRQYLG